MIGSNSKNCNMEEVEIKPENNLRLLKVFKTLEDANKICEILDFARQNSSIVTGS